MTLRQLQVQEKQAAGQPTLTDPVDMVSPSPFLLITPSGTHSAKWLDLWMGLVTVEGVDGFITVERLEEIGCEQVIPLEAEARS